MLVRAKKEEWMRNNIKVIPQKHFVSKINISTKPVGVTVSNLDCKVAGQ